MQKIYVAGFPFGKQLSDDLKFSDGIVSSLKGFEDNTNQIQISAPINPGNSGGPIVNESGEVVAVAVSGLAKDVTEGINFAIKSSAVETFLKANKVKPSSSFYSRKLNSDKLLELLMEGAGTAPPIIYNIREKQFVSFVSTGGNFFNYTKNKKKSSNIYTFSIN